MNDKMAIFIFSVNVINRLLLSFLVLAKVITLSGVHCSCNNLPNITLLHKSSISHAHVGRRQRVNFIYAHCSPVISKCLRITVAKTVKFETKFNHN